VIAASGILVVVAFVTLILGVFRTGLGLIWTSIAASVLAAVFLALGVVQGNRRRVATAGGPAEPMPSWSDQPASSTAVMERERVPARDDMEDIEEPPTLAAVPEPEPEPAVSAFEPPKLVRKPAAAAAAAKKPAAKKPAAKKPAAASSAGSVVVIPDRDKYHKDSCRYAKNPAAMSMTKAAAKRQGYKPCATCKP
jgi:hypothetical protein